MKKYLLPQTGKFFKANLHCHTTVSDGAWTPEKVKEEYKKHGYSIVAYTDHEVMVPHPELCDDEFIAMNGYELETKEYASPIWSKNRRCHMCFVALSPDLKKHVCWNEEKNGYTWGNASSYIDGVEYDEKDAHFIRTYDGECVSEMMKRGREAGFFVTYNHPTWSAESYEQYIGYNNMHAMEMVNNSCNAGGYEEYNARVYDDMLRSGKRLYCIAADDNHNKFDDSFGGFTMIKAEKLEYGLIAKALLNGDFYASQGPQIHELFVEDGKITVKTSNAVKISMITDVIHSRCLTAKEGEFVTEATFDIHEPATYFRIVVIDEHGKRACTNAYFNNEL